MEDRSNLTFTFEGDYEVDAIALVTAIDSLTKISRAIAEKEYPNVTFALSVKAITPGSLNFDFVASAHIMEAMQAAQIVFAPDIVSYAANLITAISGVFSIKKWLKGKKPKSVKQKDDKIVIENDEGLHIEAPAASSVYFNDTRADRAITCIFQSAMRSSGVTGVKLSTDKVVEIKRDEFEICAHNIDFDGVEDDCTTITRKNEVLYVRQPDFSGDLQWKFVGDQNINAHVVDEDFLSQVRSGAVSISSKTYIVADVQVKIPKGPDGLPDNKRTTYQVLKVNEIHGQTNNQYKLNT